jgi:hypothetical protein
VTHMLRALDVRLPERAPVFLCPRCQCRLSYLGSHSTAPNPRPIDLSDRYECPLGCGTYDFIRATHRLCTVGGSAPEEPEQAFAATGGRLKTSPRSFGR